MTTPPYCGGRGHTKAPTALLRAAYLVERQSLRQIARRYHMHYTVVRERLLRDGVALRPQGVWRKGQ